MNEDNAPRRTRIIVANTILECEKTNKKWVVTLVQKAWVWILDKPTPKGQVAIPVPWSAVDRLAVVAK